MSTISLPQNETLRDATVRRWHKATGDAVAAGDTLVELETEDGFVVLEAHGAGRLGQILAAAGQTVPAGSPLAELEDGGSGAPPAAPSATPEPGADSAPTAPAPPEGSVVPVLMPKAGQSVEEGMIVKWHVSEGDQIAEGQVIFEVETDKATIEVEAVDAGRLAKIIVSEDETIEVLQPVAYLAENDADVEAFLAAGSAPTATAETPAPAAASGPSAAPVAGPAPTAPAATSSSGRIKASPAARKLAAARGIDLAACGSGSGPGGRLLSTDIPTAAPAVSPTAKPTAATAPAAAVGTAAIVPTNVEARGGVRRPMRQMRKAIARNLLTSKQTIPHFYLKVMVDAESMMTFYRREKAKYPCTVNDVVTLAAARATAEFPAFRSQIDGSDIIEFPDANIGIAVGMPEGLVVPVVRRADVLSLQQLGQETRRLVEAARNGTIDGMGEGVLTITNLGMFGIPEFAGIINPPEAAILAVGAVREEVIVSGGTMRPGQVMTATLSCDHRIIDGMLAAKFLGRLKQLLEAPELLRARSSS